MDKLGDKLYIPKYTYMSVCEQKKCNSRES